VRVLHFGRFYNASFGGLELVVMLLLNDLLNAWSFVSTH